MSYTYHLDYNRHALRSDDLSIRPYPSSKLSSTPPAVLHASVHHKHLTLRTAKGQGQKKKKQTVVATAKYPADKPTIQITAAAAGRNVVTLNHSYAQFDARGHSRENPRPQRSFWRRRIKDGSRGCYVTTLGDGTRLRWEPAEEGDGDGDGDLGRNKKKKKMKSRADRMRPRMRCVLVDGRGVGVAVLGEMMPTNDVVRLAGRGELAGEGGLLGVYVLLGFVSLYERARARDKKRAEEYEMDLGFFFDAIASGGDGGGGGGDGGGGGGDGGGGGGST
ncbi:uncharacterized protein GGS25DRAFT_526254 [Hypoxylon fragiforme]|uniref:uncharacterized protein n=1 Tax=Hypoxylon fragiforme TaxID=63214 RepID=UPI0020C68616|nr:uncharacterized protein GGS25DRAFT_526254 [Hypoxylon fragiforme]KAI2603212.1 hypothetical protein GGS25DRAFT_526254 [Hypoxylon fragiforme]